MLTNPRITHLPLHNEQVPAYTFPGLVRLGRHDASAYGAGCNVVKIFADVSRVWCVGCQTNNLLHNMSRNAST